MYCIPLFFQKGVQQEYELGQFLRNRYDGFLSKTYQKDEVTYCIEWRQLKILY